MVTDYVRSHRPTDDPFDVVVQGSIHADVAAIEAAGATWFLAGPSSDGEPIEETLGWVAAGPR